MDSSSCWLTASFANHEIYFQTIVQLLLLEEIVLESHKWDVASFHFCSFLVRVTLLACKILGLENRLSTKSFLLGDFLNIFKNFVWISWSHHAKYSSCYDNETPWEKFHWCHHLWKVLHISDLVFIKKFVCCIFSRNGDINAKDLKYFLYFQ